MRSMKTILLAVIMVAATQAMAAFEELEIGISAQAMGGTGAVLYGQGAVLWNPAAIAGTQGIAVTASGRLPFTSMDFATFGLDGAFPVTRSWSGGVSLRYFGGELYNEQAVALTMAGMLTEDMSFGIQPVICSASIADGVTEYGSATAFAVNAGFQVRMYTRWMLAASVRNPFQARLGTSGEYLQRRIDAGIRYEPAPGMTTALTLSRDFRGLRLHVGQRLPLGPFSLMAGVQSNPVTVSGGFSAEAGGIGLEYAVVTHSELDLTHQAGVTYVF